MKASVGEKIFDVFNVVFLAIVSLVTLYPLIYVISNSISDISAVLAKEVVFFPKGITFKAYSIVLKQGDLLRAYYNTLWYTIVGTALSVLLTTSAAYPLSRKSYSIRSQIMVYLAITMYFSGGLVPEYILINNLGLYNTRWVMVILGAVSVSKLVVARVFFQSNIPEELSEAARIDGANDIIIYFKIVLPLSKAILAVLTLQYAVDHWNEFFKALVYLSDSKLQPLALYLRRILIMGSGIDFSQESGIGYVDEYQVLAMKQQHKYASIVITMLPIMCFYPFLQKYFVKGVMVGALKE